MLPLLLLLLLVVYAVGVLLFQGAALLFAAQMPRIDPPVATPSGAELPRISVIVAARNEELDLGGCLEDLVHQDYPNLEIIVVDGGSTDRTREVATEYAPRVQLIEEPPLPAGWVGKNWGCEVGYRAATGAWLLFTDADLRYHPGAVRATYEWAQAERSALTTLAPRIETGSFWERVVMPFYIQMVLLYFRAPRTNRPRSRSAVANGQFWLTDRASYESTGGHAAVRGFVLEDVRIAQRYRAAGLRMRIGWSPDLLSTRMYRDRTEMFEGLLKNIHGTEFSVVRQVGFLAALVGFYWLPLALAPLGALTGSTIVLALGIVVSVALFAKHVGFARVTGTPGRYGLLYPVAVEFYVALVLRSLGDRRRRVPIVWKGRAYPASPPPPNPPTAR